MRILSCDTVGNDAVHSVASLLTDAGYTLPDPPEAHVMIFALVSHHGNSISRLGGPDVSVNRGAPLALTEKIVLTPVSSRVGSQPAWSWSLNGTFLWLATGDTVSTTVWCK